MRISKILYLRLDLGIPEMPLVKRTGRTGSNARPATLTQRLNYFHFSSSRKAP
jgi:hypothetical protein